MKCIRHKCVTVMGHIPNVSTLYKWEQNIGTSSPLIWSHSSAASKTLHSCYKPIRILSLTYQTDENKYRLVLGRYLLLLCPSSIWRLIVMTSLWQTTRYSTYFDKGTFTSRLVSICISVLVQMFLTISRTGVFELAAKHWYQAISQINKSIVIKVDICVSVLHSVVHVMSWCHMDDNIQEQKPSSQVMCFLDSSRPLCVHIEDVYGSPFGQLTENNICLFVAWL